MAYGTMAQRMTARMKVEQVLLDAAQYAKVRRRTLACLILTDQAFRVRRGLYR